jgi:hypothetical protein
LVGVGELSDSSEQMTSAEMGRAIEDRQESQLTAVARRGGIALVALTSLAAGFLAGEAALIAPVLFFASWLGFLPGLIAFTSSCVVLGLAVLVAIDHFWPSRVAPASTAPLEKGPIRTKLERIGRRSRTAGAIAVAWYCGPFVSPPILRAFGYQGRRLMTWVIVSGLLFGAFWFSFYGGAFSVVKRILL